MQALQLPWAVAAACFLGSFRGCAVPMRHTSSPQPQPSACGDSSQTLLFGCGRPPASECCTALTPVRGRIGVMPLSVGVNSSSLSAIWVREAASECCAAPTPV
eukprot:1159795-Pelagomonas_calceolata.AAC.2